MEESARHFYTKCNTGITYLAIPSLGIMSSTTGLSKYVNVLFNVIAVAPSNTTSIFSSFASTFPGGESHSM